MNFSFLIMPKEIILNLQNDEIPTGSDFGPLNTYSYGIWEFLSTYIFTIKKIQIDFTDRKNIRIIGLLDRMMTCINSPR